MLKTLGALFVAVAVLGGCLPGELHLRVALPINIADGSSTEDQGEVVAQIRPTCWVFSEKGEVVAKIEDCTFASATLPTGKYRVRVDALCQPSSWKEIVVDRKRQQTPFWDTDADRVTQRLVVVAAPKPLRVYLKSGQQLEEYPSALTAQVTDSRTSTRASNGPFAVFPPNTELDLMRWWPHPESKQCTLTVVRIVDAGGPVPFGHSHASWLGGSWDRLRPRDVVGKLYVAAPDQLATDRQGPSAADYVALQKEREKEAERQERLAEAALVAKEIENGRCDTHRYNLLQQVLGSIKFLVDNLDSGQFDIIGQQPVVATPNGAVVEVSDWLAGELHLFALGFDPVRLEVRDSKNYEIRIRSAYEGLVRSRGESDSRVLHVNSGDTVTVRVNGNGCALVFAVRKY